MYNLLKCNIFFASYIEVTNRSKMEQCLFELVKEHFPHQNYVEREWVAVFAVTLGHAAMIYEQYLASEISMRDFLWCLYFLKNNPTNDAAAFTFRVPATNYIRVVRTNLPKMNNLLPNVNFLYYKFIILRNLKQTQIDFFRRFHEWDIEVPSCIVDGFDVPVREPFSNRDLSFNEKKVWFSTKIGHVAIKYLLAVHCDSGEIVWLSCPHPGGTYEPNMCAEILGKRTQNEKFCADRLYRYHHAFITSDGDHSLKSDTVDSLRSLVERVIKKIRVFAVLGDEVWRRTAENNLEFHYLCAQVVCKIINCKIINAE